MLRFNAINFCGKILSDDISIHLMLRFNVHVSPNLTALGIISIHLMLRFNNLVRIKCK